MHLYELCVTSRITPFSPDGRRTRAAASSVRWTPLRLGARRRPDLAAVHKDDPTLHGHMIGVCVDTRSLSMPHGLVSSTVDGVISSGFLYPNPKQDGR